MNRAEKMRSMGFWAVFRGFVPYLAPRWREFGIGVCLILFNTALEVTLPGLIGYSVDELLSKDPQVTKLKWLATIFLITIIVKAVSETAQSFLIQSSGQQLTHALRTEVFAHIVKLPISYFDRNHTGRLLTRVINDIKSLSELFTASISVLVLDALVVLGTVIAMFFLSPRYAFWVLLSFPAVLVVIHIFGVRLGQAYRNVRLHLAEINAFLGENIGAVATIQRLAAEASRNEKFSQVVEHHQEAQMNSLRVFAAVQPYANVLNGISIASVIYVGGLGVHGGWLTVGVVVAFLGYTRNLFQPVRDFVEKYNTALAAMVSAERVLNILAEPTESEGDLPPAQALPPSSEVEFRDVDFRYGNEGPALLQGISFRVAKGKSTAVVGATGSGKSTLIRLLLRFYDPQAGSISVGGKDIREWNRRELRSQIGVVHQDVILFDGTLRENLVLNRTGISDECLQGFLRRVQLWSIVESRGGLDMKLEEGGGNLSVGERQLLAFARVLVSNPPILILDEATASLDRILEKKLLAAIDEVTTGRTSIVIAHRLATIQHCDEILVLSHGRVVERGGYSQLVGQSEIFSRLHELQMEARPI